MIFRPTIAMESLHKETNENGNMIFTFETNRNMVISCTMFHKQKKYTLYIYIYIYSLTNLNITM